MKKYNHRIAIDPILGSFCRAIAHSVLAIAIVWLFWALLSWFGVSEILSVGLGIVFALAPGVNDYLGRDILGNKIEGFNSVDDDNLFLKFREGKYTRNRRESVNASDFVFISRILKEKYKPLVSLVADLDLEQWRSIDPESELVGAIMESLTDEIDETPHWAKGNKLPLYPLFLVDLLECLQNEMSIDHVFEEEKQGDVLKRKNHE